MAESRDAHVIDIPAEEDSQQYKCCDTDNLSVMQHHPLLEISQSLGHLLLLKLWHREEDKFNRQIALKENLMDNMIREVFQLCCFVFGFLGFLLTFLFNSSIQVQEHSGRKWWIPLSLSLTTSLFVIFFIQLNIFRYHKVSSQLHRDRSDCRALVRSIQELRMKGASFDLSKEPLATRRMKSFSVKIRWKLLEGCSKYMITICLLCFTGFVVSAGKFILLA